MLAMAYRNSLTSFICSSLSFIPSSFNICLHLSILNIVIVSIISPIRGYAALCLPLQLIEWDFCSAGHTATLAHRAQLSYSLYHRLIFGLLSNELVLTSTRLCNYTKRIFKKQIRKISMIRLFEINCNLFYEITEFLLRL